MARIAEAAALAGERTLLPISPRRWRFCVAGVLLLAGLWRLALALGMPCISRDGASYCWYARDLGRSGLRLLAGGQAGPVRYEQHPGFPAAILVVQRLLRLCGARDVPATWQHAGQAVALLSGMAVVVLSGLLAARLAGRLKLPPGPRRAALWALLLAALLPLNTWHSADVMSDELHLAWYLAGVVCLLSLDTPRVALAAGLFSGLAFLTRPEGATVCLAGLVVLLTRARAWAARRVGGLAALLLGGFLVCAGPYWAVSGQLSPKLNKQTLRQAAGPSARWSGPGAGVPRVRQAALLRREVGWHLLLPRVLYTTCRAGRVVVPLLALVPLVYLRRRLGRPPLAGPLACVLLHLVLAGLLLRRYGYLDPRHLLVVVGLLVPLAALALGGAVSVLAALGRPALAAAVAALCLGPLAFYSLRLPNGADAFVARSAEWLVGHDPQAGGRLLLGGSSQRRIAFYADMRFQPWPENRPTPAQRLAALRAHLLHNRPDYFAIASGPGRERAANAALLAALRGDAALGRRLTEVHAEPDGRGAVLHLLRLDWSRR